MKARAGYTLLEVILAVGISLLLVAALYVALDVQMRYMQTGRDAVAEGQLARGLVNRVTADVRASLGRVAVATNVTDTGSEALGDGQVNYGVVGDEYRMTLFLSNVPRYGRGETNLAAAASDMRAVTYYLIPEGLARQEVRVVTADSLDAEPEPDVLAAEVVDLRFQYYDAGTGTWVTTWDGTQTGPPMAIEIVMGILPPREGRPPETLYYRTVVAVPAANPTQETQSGASGGTP